MGVSGIQSNYTETPYGDIQNTEQAIACAIWCSWARWVKEFGKTHESILSFIMSF